MKAVLMAGGAGARLRPLTIERPKPLIPVANKPIMGHVLDVLKANHILDVIITLQYRAELIQEHFRSGAALGMNLSYCVEETPLGTAGSVRQVSPAPTETFIVASADALTDFELAPIIEAHHRCQALATLVLTRVTNPLEYGVIVTDEEGRVIRFQEKPGWGDLISDTVNTGIYILEPEILNWVPRGEAADWSRDVFPRLLAAGQPLFGYVAEGYWCDIGDVPEYFRACADLLSRQVHVPAIGRWLGDEVCAGEGVEISADARIFGPVYLGDGAVVKSGVVINGPATIGPNTIIDEGAQIDRSHIWPGSYVGPGVELHEAIIGQHCSLKARSVFFEGVIIGDNNVVGEKAVLHREVKVWPGKEIEPGAIVKSSVIWSAKGRRALFGPFGVTGVVNIDLTPEMVARLGASFAATLRKGSWVTINHGLHRSPHMFKRALVAGLASAGVNVWDLQGVPIPVARYYTHISGCAAGVDVRLSPHDSQVVDIRFIGKDGLNLSRTDERTVEWIHFREDFRRADTEEVGIIEDATNVVECYCEDFLQKVEAKVIQQRSFQVVVDYSHSPATSVLLPIFTRLNVKVVPLNAQLDDSKVSVRWDERQRWLHQLSKIVSVLETDLGVQLDAKGEQLLIVTERGALVPNDIAALMMAELALRANQMKARPVVQPRIAVPVNQTVRFEEVARAYGAEIIWTKVNQYELMQAAAGARVILAADGKGHFIFPEFQPVVDGLMALARLLEFMALLDTSISEAVAGLPSFYVAHSYVSCGWERKGQIMRLVNDRFKDSHRQALDGLKVFFEDGRWVLIRPDPYQPGFQISAEAGSLPQAEQMVREYRELIRSLED